MSSDPRLVYASWPHRAAGYLINVVLTAIAAVPGYVLILLGETTTTTTTDPDRWEQMTINDDGTMTPIPLTTTSTDWDTTTTIGFVLVYAATIAFFVWNQCVRQGRTGYSYGNQIVGIKLVGDATGTVIGPGRSFVRQVAHILDTLPCYLGWFWPLWDRKCQTFADKAMDTVVIVQR